MTINCFYEPAGMFQDRETETVLLWQKYWQSLGYNTRVLSESNATKHAAYKDLVAACDSSATALDRTFQRFCFVRWCALLKAGGGVFTDYDVLPRPWFKMPVEVDGGICGDVTLCPGFVVVNKTWCEEFIQHSIDHKDIPEFNDMDVIRSMVEPFKCVLDLVRGFGDRGWMHSPLVHFHNNALYRNRATCIDYLMK